MQFKLRSSWRWVRLTILDYSGETDWTPWNKDTSINRTLFAVSNATFVYNLTPEKSGHLTNQDTFFYPKGVQIREVPL